MPGFRPSLRSLMLCVFFVAICLYIIVQGLAYQRQYPGGRVFIDPVSDEP